MGSVRGAWYERASGLQGRVDLQGEDQAYEHCPEKKTKATKGPRNNVPERHLRDPGCVFELKEDAGGRPLVFKPL